MDREIWLGLVSKEGIVQLLIVHLDLAQFGTKGFAGFRFELLLVFLLFDGVAHVADARVFDEVGQGKLGLFNAAAGGQIPLFRAPVLGNGHGIVVGLEVDEKARVCGGHIEPLEEEGVCVYEKRVMENPSPVATVDPPPPHPAGQQVA